MVSINNEMCQWHSNKVTDGIHICCQAFFPRAYSPLHGGVLTVPQPTRSCLTSKISWRSSSGWLQLIFSFQYWNSTRWIIIRSSENQVWSYQTDTKVTHFSKLRKIFSVWHVWMKIFLTLSNDNAKVEWTHSFFQPVRFCNLNHESVFRKIFALLFLEALIPPTVDLIYTHGRSHNHNDCPRIMDVVLGSVILSCLRCWWGKV